MSSQNKQRNPAKQLNHILTIAHRLLTSSSGSSFTMDQLARETGLSRATLYRHVGSREALLKRIAREQGIEAKELTLPDIRTRTLQATRRVISAISSFNFTVEQVAIEAGLGVATVYRHFGDKEGLLKAFSQELEPRRAARELVLQAQGDMEEELIRFASSTLTFTYQHRDLSRLLFSGDEKTQRLLAPIRANQDRTLTRLTQYFEAQIQAGRIKEQDSFDLSTAFVGLLLSFVLVKPAYVNAPPDDPERAARFIVRLFLDGARRQTDPTSIETKGDTHEIDAA
jgi:AcrR family transcriptional regulator